MLYCVQCKHYEPDHFRGYAPGKGQCRRPRPMKIDPVTGRETHMYPGMNLSAEEERMLPEGASYALTGTTPTEPLPPDVKLCGPRALFFEPEGPRPVARQIHVFPVTYTNTW